MSYRVTITKSEKIQYANFTHEELSGKDKEELVSYISDELKKVLSMNIDHKNECYYCQHKELVPGNCHIRCSNPDWSMTGDEHGIDSGWFIYPLLFDPIWKTAPCKNFLRRKDK